MPHTLLDRLFAVRDLPGAVFFPCINGGNMALTAVAAAIVFREKLRPSQIAGVIGAAAAIVLIAVL